MTHTINKSNFKTTTPTGLYEANYRRLLHMMPEILEIPVKGGYSLSVANITLQIVEHYTYTSIISLKQLLKTDLSESQSTHLKSMSHLSAIDMDLRVCHDARVVEVIAYQGKSPIHSSNIYPNKHMLQIDEKRQLNLLLRDVLESALKAGFNRKHMSPSCN